MKIREFVREPVLFQAGADLWVALGAPLLEAEVDEDGRIRLLHLEFGLLPDQLQALYGNDLFQDVDRIPDSGDSVRLRASLDPPDLVSFLPAVDLEEPLVLLPLLFDEDWGLKEIGRWRPRGAGGPHPEDTSSVPELDSAWLDEAFADGAADRLGDAVDLQLLVEPPDVRADRVDRDA